jgi:hypothetical protein
MAKRLLHHNGLVLLKTGSSDGLPIFLKVNHQLESRMPETACSVRREGRRHTASLPYLLPNVM